LDRDGVINREVDLLYREDQLDLLPGAAEAIRRLNDAGILAIVVTNQPVVARNLCTEDDVCRIHERLQEMLKEAAGARLDAVYYCPHHPETHHQDGNPAYRGRCRSRGGPRTVRARLCPLCAGGRHDPRRPDRPKRRLPDHPGQDGLRRPRRRLRRGSRPRG